MGRPTLTERRKAQTRREIAETALVLFAREGYDGVSAEAIAEEAGVSLRTFYRYFTGKDAVLSPIVTTRSTSWPNASRPAPRPRAWPPHCTTPTRRSPRGKARRASASSSASSSTSPHSELSGTRTCERSKQH